MNAEKMNMGNGPFEVVKESLTARQVAEYYGLKVNRSGMACCPFHGDQHPSMKIDKRYFCFACNEKGDAIDYVSKMFGIPVKDAAIKICEDFGLAYDTQRRGSPPKVVDPKPQKSEEQLFDEFEKYIHRILCEYLHVLKKWKIEYEPNTADEEWHPRYVEALQEIDHTEYLLDTLQEGDILDRALCIYEQGRKVREIEKRLRRINEESSGDSSEHIE